jgi:hypothetical protein
MSLFSVAFTGDGTTGPLAVPFPYIAKSHVHVFVNDVEVGFSFQTSATILLNVAAPIAAPGLIKRVTPNAQPLVDWENGANINDENLDINTRQLLYIFQEAIDAATAAAEAAAQQIAQGVIDSAAAQAAAILGNISANYDHFHFG